jgi:hypothetical protein
MDERRLRELVRQRRRHGRPASGFPVPVRLSDVPNEALTVLIVTEADVRAMPLIFQQDERSHEAARILDEDFAVVYATRFHVAA